MTEVEQLRTRIAKLEDVLQEVAIVLIEPREKNWPQDWRCCLCYGGGGRRDEITHKPGCLLAAALETENVKS